MIVKMILFIFGVCLGSFINAQVYRVAIKYKLLKLGFKIENKDRSFCDFCGRQLRWYENIPVISWVMQIGKSRCCQKKLSVLYPIVETMTGLLFLQIPITKFQDINNYLDVLLVLINMAILGFLVFSAVFDLKYMILPDFSTFILIALAVVYKIMVGTGVEMFVGDMLIGLSVFSFFHFLHTLTDGNGMGYGDVKLAFFVGTFLGWRKAIIALYMAFVTGAVIGVLILVIKKNKDRLIAFGPFMILGTLTAWWWGDRIWTLAEKVLY